MSTSEYKLFQPITVGDLILHHRVVVAPLTRFRNNSDHVPLPPAAEYYAQRASVRGTLIITEATFIAAKAGGYAHAPGIYTLEQVDAWRKVSRAIDINTNGLINLTHQLYRLLTAFTPRVHSYIFNSGLSVVGRGLRTWRKRIPPSHSYPHLPSS